MKKIIHLISILLIVSICCLLVCCTDEQVKNSTNTSNQDGENLEMMEFMYIYCGENRLEIQFANTVSAKALIEKLKQGDITISMSDYGSFEKVGSLGYSLAQNDIQTKTTTGDVVLYNGNNIVIFYGSNSWAYTKIGKIKDANANTIKEFFTENNVRFSLT